MRVFRRLAAFSALIILRLHPCSGAARVLAAIELFDNDNLTSTAAFSALEIIKKVKHTFCVRNTA